MKVVSNASCVRIIFLEDNSQVNFMPGLNYVNNELVKKHPHFKALVKSGQFVVQEEKLIPSAKEKLKGKKKDAPIAFKDMETKSLLADIDNMFDIELLERIKSEDPRLKVQHAASARLNLIDEKTKKVDE